MLDILTFLLELYILVDRLCQQQGIEHPKRGQHPPLLWQVPGHLTDRLQAQSGSLEIRDGTGSPSAKPNDGAKAGCPNTWVLDTVTAWAGTKVFMSWSPATQKARSLATGLLVPRINHSVFD